MSQAELKVSTRLMEDYKFVRKNKATISECDQELFNKFKDGLSKQLKTSTHSEAHTISTYIQHQVNELDSMLDGIKTYSEYPEIERSLKLLYLTCHYHYPLLKENIYKNIDEYFYDVALKFNGKSDQLEAIMRYNYPYPSIQIIHTHENEVKLEEELTELEKIHVHKLDLETRLLLDRTFYEEEVNQNTVELKIFNEFYGIMLEELELQDNLLVDTNHSFEMQMFKRDYYAVKHFLDRLDVLIETAISTGILKYESWDNQLRILDMLVRYRYYLGLLNGQETLNTYYQKRMGNFLEHINIGTIDYTLPTLRASQFQNSMEATPYISNMLEHLLELSKEDEHFLDVYNRLLFILLKIELPTKEGQSFVYGNLYLSFQEQVAVHGELIFKAKNELRDSIIENNEHTKYIYTLMLNFLYSYSSFKDDQSIREMLPLLQLKKIDESIVRNGISGIGVAISTQNYDRNIRMRGPQGYGVAAELGNNLIDKLLLKDAQILGNDNVKNGADRFVDGEYIQTKYWENGTVSINKCFANGEFKYQIDGKPMVIEVAKGEGEAAREAMRRRIRNGEMKNVGITDEAMADQFVKEGWFTQETAKRIAKAGTIEGITYDAVNAAIEGSVILGISFASTYAMRMWNGEDNEDALKDALKTAGEVYGKYIVQQVITAQLGRTSLDLALRPAADFAVEKIYSKNLAKIINRFFVTNGKPLTSNMLKLKISKTLRGTAVSLTIQVAITSSSSIYDAIHGRISGKQLTKNVVNTTASVTGGLAGQTIGKAAGTYAVTAISTKTATVVAGNAAGQAAAATAGKLIGGSLGNAIPVVGTIAGSIIGGYIAGKGVQFIMDAMIDDDSIEMMELLSRLFVESCKDYGFDHNELNYITDKIFMTKKLSTHLKELHAAPNKQVYVEQMMDPYIDALLMSRSFVTMPI